MKITNFAIFMSFLKISLLAVTLLFGFSSCNKYSKIMKSKDVAYKLRMADKFYEEKKYSHAQMLYEELYPVFKGTDKFEELYTLLLLVLCLAVCLSWHT